MLRPLSLATVLLLAPAAAQAAQIPVAGATGVPQHAVAAGGAQAVTWGTNELSGCVLAATASSCTAWTSDFGADTTMAGYGLGYTTSGPLAVAVRNTGAAGTAELWSDVLADTTTPAFKLADTGTFVNPSGSAARFHGDTIALTVSHLTDDAGAGDPRRIRVVAVDTADGFQDDVTPATPFTATAFSDHELMLGANAGRPVVVTQSPAGNVQHAFYDGPMPGTVDQLNTTNSWKSASAVFLNGANVLDLASGPAGLFMLATLTGSDPRPYLYTHRYTAATQNAQSTGSFTSTPKKPTPLVGTTGPSSLAQDAAGKLYLGYLVAGATWVATSTDGGATWTAPLPIDCAGSSSARVAAGGPGVFLLGEATGGFTLASASDRPAECQPKEQPRTDPGTGSTGGGSGGGAGTTPDSGAETKKPTTNQVVKTIAGVKVALKTPASCVRRGTSALLVVEPVKGVSLKGAKFKKVLFTVNRRKATRKPDTRAPFKVAVKTTRLKAGAHKVGAKVTIKPRGGKPQTRTITGKFTVC